MSGEILPGGDRGEHRIPWEDFVSADGADLDAFAEAVRREAHARRLLVIVEQDLMTGDVIVRWRP